jgi:hypothetical protein
LSSCLAETPLSQARPVTPRRWATGTGISRWMRTPTLDILFFCWGVAPASRCGKIQRRGTFPRPALRPLRPDRAQKTDTF